MKKITFWISAFITGLYSTFVAQCFWNWFAVPVLLVSPISFWEMMGIILLINLFTEKDDSIEKHHWESVYKLLDACVPKSKKKDIEEFLNEKNENKWVDAGFKILEKFLSNTVILIIGFVVYVMMH